MSIVASIKVYDGIVLGADSKTQLASKGEKGEINFVKAYDHAQKLFPLEIKGKEERGLPIGILTYGVGNIGGRSIESYIIDFTNQLRADLTEHKKIEAIIEKDEELQKASKDTEKLSDVQYITFKLLELFKNTFSEQYKDTPRKDWPKLGVFVAGYSQGSALGEEWEFLLPDKPKIQKVRKQEKFGASWRGMSIPFTRLFYGFDPRAEAKLKDQETSEEMLRTFDDIVKGFPSQVVFDGTAIQK